MPFDDTILDIILIGDAAAKAQASAALDDGHPNAFIETIGATVERAQLATEATSNSSVTIGTGNKTFQLVSSRGWKAGLPVIIRNAAAPSTDWMAGQLTVDETGTGEITVNVVYTKGSGTFTSWLIGVVLLVSTVVSPPVAIADGGTGANTAATARASLQVVLTKFVIEARTSPPGFANAGDVYLVLPTATGLWAGQDNDFATFDGANWSFTTPEDGAQAFEFQGDFGNIFRWSAWTQNWVNVGALAMGLMPYQALSSTQTLSTGGPGSVDDRWKHFITTTGGITITIPQAAAYLGLTLLITHKGTGTVTINVSGGGTINGATSIQLTQWQTARLHSIDAGSPEWVQW